MIFSPKQMLAGLPSPPHHLRNAFILFLQYQKYLESPCSDVEERNI